MKTIKLFILIILSTSISILATAQTTEKASAQKTETFKVSGACGMCKDRIEKIAKAEGATSAVWDVKLKMLTVAFDPSRTGKDALSKKIAAVGHDTEKHRAPDEVYAKLPGCCHYERNK